MFTITPAVLQRGLFSPGEKDETGEELSLNPSYYSHHISVHHVCVYACVHVLINMTRNISRKASISSVFFIPAVLCEPQITVISKMDWIMLGKNWYVFGRGSGFLEQSKKLKRLQTCKLCFTGLRCGVKHIRVIHSVCYWQFEEAELFAVFVQLIKYLISCPHVWSVVN